MGRGTIVRHLLTEVIKTVEVPVEVPVEVIRYVDREVIKPGLFTKCLVDKEDVVGTLPTSFAISVEVKKG